MTKPRTRGWFTLDPAGSRKRLRLAKLGGIVLVCCAAVIASPAQVFNTLVNFNGTDGSSPEYGSLMQGADGNFYGTTLNGGTGTNCSSGCGTVFQLTPGGTLTTLYSFAGSPDGANPYAGLIQANGNFYGTTYAGGAANANCSNGCGTVYELSPSGGTWTESVLYSFCQQANCQDGIGPTAGLVQGSDGNFYGTTYAGGGGNCVSGCGSIFSITPQGALTILHNNFNRTQQGAQFFAGLVQGADGNFYGTTEGGGSNPNCPNGCGTVFEITPGGTFSSLYSFGGAPDGSYPYAGLIQGIDGNLYGTTYYGGNSNSLCSYTCGTVYEMSQQGGTWTESVLYSFCAQVNCPDGAHPYAGLIQAADANFYGTASSGGATADGTVFKMIKTTAGTSSLYVLNSFCAQSNCTDGESPFAGLVQASNGNFYGTTTSGGANAAGTVFGLYQTNITTWHNDNLRTGQNTNEIVLTPQNLSSNNFGQLCSVALDGQVYAEPLVLSDVTFNGTQYSSLVYVVTEMNTLYVINGTPPAPNNPCTVITSLSLTPAGQSPADCRYLGGEKCSTIAPVIGALGTPVIQMAPNSIGTLYVVTETQDASPFNWYHYLHAVNLDQVAELTAPVRVFPPTLLKCLACLTPQASLWSHQHIQRPGLLLVGNNLYIAFSMMDGNLPLPNGSVFRYDVTNLNAPPAYFATTPDDLAAGGGIWQDGAGLAYGADGPPPNGTNYIYFNTGNGLWDGISNWGDSFVKLDPSKLTVADYFTPSDESYRNSPDPYTDLDFGSGGVMLTPASSSWPFLAVSGDKEGGIWAMDRGDPGEFNDNGDQNLQTVWPTPSQGPIHNTPAYWNNFIYVAPRMDGPQTGQISQYQICNDYPGGQPFCDPIPVYATNVNGNGYITTKFGATPMVSSSPDASDGILWLTSGDATAKSLHPGGLYAVDAYSMTGLYVNTGCSADAISPVTKFSVPTVANGYVYLGTQAVVDGVNNGGGTFYIFGPGRTCPGNAKTRPKSKRRVSTGSSKTGIATPSLDR